MAPGIVEEARQAQPGDAAAAAAPSAQAEALPPLVVTPALEAAVRAVLEAQVAYVEVDERFSRALEERDPDFDWSLGQAIIVADAAVHAAIEALEREVAGGADRADEQ